MLLVDCVRLSSIQSFNLFAICRLQWTKDSEVTRLELIGGMRRNTIKDDIIFKTILYNFERLVRPEAVINKNPWFLIRPWFDLGIKYIFNPVQADLGVGVSRLGALKMPSKGGVCSLYASMGCCWPDDQWKERPTVCINALNRSHHCSLDTRASISSQVVLTY